MMDYHTWKYPALKKECAERGLGGAGKAVELIARLEASDSTPVGFEVGAEVPNTRRRRKAVDVPRETKPEPKDTDPDPNHIGYPNWDMKGRWIRR